MTIGGNGGGGGCSIKNRSPNLPIDNVFVDDSLSFSINVGGGYPDKSALFAYALHNSRNNHSAEGATFRVDPCVGFIYSTRPFDYEARKAFLLPAKGIDRPRASDTGTATVSIVDVDELSATALADPDPGINAVAQEANPGTEIGITAASVDVDGSTNAVADPLVADETGPIFVPSYWTLFTTSEQRGIEYKASDGSALGFSSIFRYDSSLNSMVYENYDVSGSWLNTWFYRYQPGFGIAEWQDYYPLTGYLATLFGPVGKVVMSTPIGWGEWATIGTTYTNSPVIDFFRSWPPQSGTGYQAVIFEDWDPVFTLSDGTSYSDVLVFSAVQTWGGESQALRFWMAKGIGPIAVQFITIDPITSLPTETVRFDRTPLTTIAGTAGADNYIGTDGPDRMLGLAGRDIFNGLGGDDTLDGGADADRLIGGTGNDIFIFDNSGDIATELAGQGVDTVQSSVSISALGDFIDNLTLTGTSGLSGTGNSLNNSITGNSGANSLAGLGGNDTLLGAAGNDTLNGGAGNDTLNGGAGRETLTGGADRDTFVFTAVSEIGNTTTARDMITDFRTGTDLLNFAAIDANTLTSGDQAFVFIGSAAFSAPGQLRLSGGILFGNVDSSTAADFQIAMTGVTRLIPTTDIIA